MASPSTIRRRELRRWVLQRFGNGNVAPCAGCDRLLNHVTLTLDRYPVPGKFGGGYARTNVRPMCFDCNSHHVGEPVNWVECPELTHKPFEELNWRRNAASTVSKRA